MTLSPDWHARLLGPRPLSEVFSRPGTGGQDAVGVNVLSTYRGPFPDKVHAVFDKLGLTNGERVVPTGGGGRDAARSAADLGSSGAADTTAEAALLAQVPTTSNPVYGGLLAQRAYAEAGLVLPRVVGPADGAEAFVGDAAAVANDGAAAAAAATGGGAAATAGAPASAAEQSMMQSFERLSTLSEQQRLDVLSGALEQRFAAGKGPSTLEVLTSAVITGPFEDSAPAVQESLDRVLAAAAADVTAAGAHAAPAAAVEHAAPVATAVVEHAAPIATAAVEHAAPVATAAVEHAAPLLLDDALAGARAILRGGGPTQLYGMEQGITRALKLLRA